MYQRIYRTLQFVKSLPEWDGRTLIAVGILVSIAADTAEPGYNERYRNSLRRKLSFLPWFRQYRDGE